MCKQDFQSRLSTALAVGGLMFAPIAPVLAQPAPRPDTTPALVDPPSRVGRLARIVGTVSFHTTDQTEWETASLNYPVTSGNSFWTQPRAEAEIEVGSTHLALNESTELDVDTLVDHAMATTEVQGEIYLRLRAVLPGDTTIIRTPRGEITIAVAGRYNIVAGDTEHPTTVTVVEGTARIAGPSLSLDVGPHQTATITGSDNFTGSVGPQLDDPFLRAQLQREVPPPAVARYVPPPAVEQMTGADALQTTGQWTPTPQYGEVWYPPVQRGWVPYREGHWAWVAPWGWTWVDDASWGFAPFHYGRWVEVDQRWGWIPRIESAPIVAYPVYAPALVSFVDVAAGVIVGAAIGSAFGWIPLGAREPYYPPYVSSPAYLQNVNSGNVNNVTTITNIRNTTINNYANRGAATVVPASVLQASQPVAPQAQAIPARQFASLRPVQALPVRPTLATAGVTPAVAKAMNLPAVAGAPPSRPAAPGPVVQARPAGIVALRPPGGAVIPAVAPQVPAIPTSGAVPSAEPARSGLGAVGAGALVGGAAGVGAAALLNRNAQSRQGTLPPLAAFGTGVPATAPGAAPGPAIRPHGAPALNAATPTGTAPAPGAPATPVAARPVIAPPRAAEDRAPVLNGVSGVAPAAPAARLEGPRALTVPAPGAPATPVAARPVIPPPRAVEGLAPVSSGVSGVTPAAPAPRLGGPRVLTVPAPGAPATPVAARPVTAPPRAVERRAPVLNGASGVAPAAPAPRLEAPRALNVPAPVRAMPTATLAQRPAPVANLAPPVAAARPVPMIHAVQAPAFRPPPVQPAPPPRAMAPAPRPAAPAPGRRPDPLHP